MKKIYLNFLFYLLTINQLCSQTILNTEKLMSKIDSTFVFGIGFDGNMERGNIELTESNLSLQLGKKTNNSLLRFVLSHEYESDSQEVLSNDFSGQIRYNYSIENNSFFSFIQAQNIRSLKMLHRYLIGVGYRFNVFKKNLNYFDLSAGIFYEDELYEDNQNQIKVYNYKYSFSSFSTFFLDKKLSLNTSVYYQFNSSSLKDYRIYFEPRLYFSLNKVDLFITYRNRFHSKPYVDVKRNDAETSVGLEIYL
tara:strand:+ start:624 stop:1376 length:753 start_codon:yes stop_codon:yes gene_type:complete